MGRAVHLSVSVTEELGEFVEEKVSSGAYASQSEVVRAGLRALWRAEPADPWDARPGRKGGTKGGGGPASDVSSSGKQEASPAGLPPDDDPWWLLPEVRRHRHEMMRIAEKFGIDEVRVAIPTQRRDRSDPDDGEPELLHLVVDSDPSRPYPELIPMIRRLEELLGTAVVVWEERPWERRERERRERRRGGESRYLRLEGERGP